MPKVFIFTKKGSLYHTICDRDEIEAISIHSLTRDLAKMDDFETDATQLDWGLGGYFYRIYRSRVAKMARELMMDRGVKCIRKKGQLHYYKPPRIEER